MAQRRNRIKELCDEHEMRVIDLARAIGMQSHALRRYTRQEAQPRLELAETIAEFFRVDLEDVIGKELITSPGRTPAGKIPAYGAAQGGTGFDITDVSAPVEMVDRPEYLSSARDPYAVYVSGDSMEPRFAHGELLYVAPGRPFKRGDDVVVQLDADGAQHAIVKKFISRSANKLVLEQLNPAQKLTLNAAEVTSIHKVTGLRTV